jgi:hypothetical protein
VNPYRRDDEPHKGARNSGGQRITLSDDERRKLDRQRQEVIGRLLNAG